MANLKVRVETLGGGDCAGIDRDAAARLLQQTFTDALYLAGLINCLPCLSPDQWQAQIHAVINALHAMCPEQGHIQLILLIGTTSMRTPSQIVHLHLCTTTTDQHTTDDLAVPLCRTLASIIQPGDAQSMWVLVQPSTPPGTMPACTQTVENIILRPTWALCTLLVHTHCIECGAQAGLRITDKTSTRGKHVQELCLVGQWYQLGRRVTRPLMLAFSAGVACGASLTMLFRAPEARLHRLLSKRNMQVVGMGRHDAHLVRTLVQTKQGYLFRGWPAAGVNDNAKRVLWQHIQRRMAGVAAGVEDARLAVLQAPVAPTKPHTVEAHDDGRVDEYYWLRDDDRKDAEVLKYLDEENAYTKAALADTDELQETLFKEMKGRIQEADQSVPVREKGYYYYNKTLEGAQYKVHCRRPVPPGVPVSEAEVMDESLPEEILLDENNASKKHPFYMVGGLEPSPNDALLAWAEDTKGGELYTLRVMEIATKKELTTAIENTSGDFVWANDNMTLFYVTKDQLDRPYKVWRHVVGTHPSKDVCVYHEQDEAFYVGLGRSRSEQLLFIATGSAITSEEHILPANNPLGEWKVLLPRQHDVEYSVSHRNDHLFITMRDAHRPNSEILVAPMSDPTKTTVLVPHREDVKIEGISVSKDFLALFERKEGLQVCTVYPLPTDGSAPTTLPQGTPLTFEEPAYELGAGAQGDFNSPVLRLVYSSLTTPTSTLDHNMKTGRRVTKKVAPVLGGFDRSNYTTLRFWATAADGVKVPVSLVYRTDMFKQDGSMPMLLDGYGSYEICNDPYFSSNRLSLVDRGWVYAIAHIRGGGELGRRWYEDGKMLKKKATFDDFIACAEYLIGNKYTSTPKLSVTGRSAGGMLMGAITNMRPDLFHAVVMGVPFVDCLTTMLDPSIPLTVIEEEEWGAPSRDKEVYDYMKSYSPVDNVKAQAYPNILVTAGLHDPRVGYWEPAKLVAKLRRMKTNNNLLLFKCEMGAGHFSASGRFDKLKEIALEYAFLLKTQGQV